MISFAPGLPNQLLINPRLSPEEKNILLDLKNEFEKKFGLNDYFLVPSSGSSKAANESVKLIALHLESILNSAKRVNFYLNAKSENSWGLFLPEFHVAGIGVLARAHLAGAAVKNFKFEVSELKKNLVENDISFLSLVPAQIFDIVQADLDCAASVKKVFVGGGFINAAIKEKAVALGWPVVETYGMTETASMIAIRESGKNRFSVMGGVNVKVENECLCIQTDSLLTATVQKTGSVFKINSHDKNSWLKTEDLAVIFEEEDGTYLQLGGRKSDYIKILGEGVSLSELRDKLQASGILLGLQPGKFELVASEKDRAGYQLVLVAEKDTDQKLIEKLVTEFNRTSRPYERISRTVVLGQIPRTDLGKLKTQELKRIIEE